MANAIEDRLTQRVGFLTRLAIVSGAQFAAGKIGDVLQTANNGGIGPVWPAAGVALAALLLWDYSVWPGVAAGAFLLALFSPLPYWAAIAYAAGTTLAAVVGAFLLQRTRFDRSLSRLRDALGLIVLGAFGSSIVSASIGAAVFYAGHVRGWSGFGSAWLVYWLGDSTGVLVVTPLVLAFPTLFRIRNRNRLRELAALLLLLTATTLIIFGDPHLVPVRLHVLAFAVLPFVMWAAIRFGMGANTLSVCLVATVATVETALGSGPFATSSQLGNAVLLDIFFGVLSVTGLILAALCAENEQAQRERQQVVSKEAAMEARLQAAKVLQLSEQRWRLAAQAGKMYAYEWDVASDAVVRSGEAVNILGPIGEASRLTRQQLLTRVHPDDRALFAASASERTPENPDTQISYRILRPDGSVLWLEKTAHAFFDERGRMVRMIGMVKDITERKLAEEARFRLAAIVESSRDAIASGTPDGIIVSWNPGAERMYGYTEAEAIGKPISILVPPELPDDENKILEALRAGGRIEQFETVRVTKTGKRINVSLSISPIKDSSGAIVGVAGIARDISERKRYEERLREYERAIENAEEMIAVVDREYRYLIANRQFLKMRNMTHQQVVGHFAHEVLKEEVFEAVVKPRLDECFQGKVVRYEMKYRYPELGERDLLISCFPIEGVTGIDRVACILQDITDRKRAEEALADMSRKLIAAQEQERARIGRELHDDINQRLAMLALELEQLQENPSEVQSCVQELRKQTTEIADDVQALSHELHSSKLEYLGVVAGMKSWCKEFADRQKVEINFRNDVARVVPFEMGVSLFRVLQEALHNALKHSGVKRIEVELREGFDEIHLTVTDQGRGFDVEAALHGKGLGLTSMRERARLVSGTITIESRPMSGTTIHVRAPLQSENGAQRAAV